MAPPRCLRGSSSVGTLPSLSPSKAWTLPCTAASSRLSVTVETPAEILSSCAASTLRQHSQDIGYRSAKAEPLPYTPRTWNGLKHNVDSMEADIDLAFEVLSQRRKQWQRSLGSLQAEAVPKAAEETAVPLAAERPPLLTGRTVAFGSTLSLDASVLASTFRHVPSAAKPADGSPSSPDISPSNARRGMLGAAERVEGKVSLAREMAGSVTPPRMGDVPLSRHSSGTLCVDVKALQRQSVVNKLRQACKSAVLKGDAIVEVSKQLEREKLQGSESSCSIMRRNRSSRALNSRRPEVRRQTQQQRARLHRSRSEACIAHKVQETEAFRQRAFEKYCERRAVYSAAELAAQYPHGNGYGRSLERSASASDGSEWWDAGADASGTHVADERVAKQARKKALAWICAEGVLQQMRASVERRIRPLSKSWGMVWTATRLLQRAWQARRRCRAATIVKSFLQGMDLGARVRSYKRVVDQNARMIQRAWRNFSAELAKKTGETMYGLWKKEEARYLNAMFLKCPGDGDIEVGDMSAIAGEQDASPTSEENTKQAATGKQGSAVRASQSSQMLRRNAIVRPHSAPPGGRPPWHSPSAKMAKPLTTSSPVLLRRSVLQRSSLTPADEFDLALDKVLEGQFKQRHQQRLQTHLLRDEVVSKIIRRELLERCYERRRADKICITRNISAQGTRIGVVSSSDAKLLADTSALRLFDESAESIETVLTLSFRTQRCLKLSPHDVQQLVLAGHLAVGARPTSDELLEPYLLQCPEWRIAAVEGLLEGRRTLRKGLTERALGQVAKNDIALKPSGFLRRPSSAPPTSMRPPLAVQEGRRRSEGSSRVESKVKPASSGAVSKENRSGSKHPGSKGSTRAESKSSRRSSIGSCGSVRSRRRALPSKPLPPACAVAAARASTEEFCTGVLGKASGSDTASDVVEPALCEADEADDPALRFARKVSNFADKEGTSHLPTPSAQRHCSKGRPPLPKPANLCYTTRPE
eukprot:TRINITY_DN41924_c0_g1_i1.p1 TRINITY_DN41924_c0_g1~~TRINITY_DN41924_c0_g1_i1.p1  ORF type:complete len:987 (-),score=195.39 TRINITY_DN41924_c0_g1_i1:347-3307(-)